MSLQQHFSTILALIFAQPLTNFPGQLSGYSIAFSLNFKKISISINIASKINKAAAKYLNILNANDSYYRYANLTC
jgi:hypothetical protein